MRESTKSKSIFNLREKPLFTLACLWLTLMYVDQEKGNEWVWRHLIAKWVTVPYYMHFVLLLTHTRLHYYVCFTSCMSALCTHTLQSHDDTLEPLTWTWVSFSLLQAYSQVLSCSVACFSEISNYYNIQTDYSCSSLVYFSSKGSHLKQSNLS